MICRQCGLEFEPKKRGRKNTGFCSKVCYGKWRNKNKPCTQRKQYQKVCLYCGLQFKATKKDQKYCSPACASRHAGDLRRGSYYCEYCGKPRYSDHPNRNRFCSSECANKVRHLKMLSRQEQKRRQHELDMTRQCVFCGESFVAKLEQQKYCCEDCRYKDALLKSRKENEARFTPLIRTCPRCGTQFRTSFYAQDKQYCSERCRERDGKNRHKLKRKEQMQKAYVEPVNIKKLYRDYHGRCAICGLPVPNTTESTNQWAATIDHVIPLSKGGEHSWLNCQLAHRLCNSVKLDTKEDFKIDWTDKLKSEPGRWDKQLDNLWYQLHIDKLLAM